MAREINRLRVIRVLRSAGYSVMAILRMLNHLDRGGRDLRYALDTPHPTRYRLLYRPLALYPF